MKEIKSIIEQSFYTHPLMLLSALIALAIGIQRRSRLKGLKLLILYPLATIIQGLIAYLSWAFDHNPVEDEVDIVSENLFVLVESVILYIFFKNIIVIKRIKGYIHLSFCIFLVYTITLWIFSDAFYWAPNKIYLVESCFVLFVSFTYLYQIFILPPSTDLFRSSEFWVTMGCVFYFSCTIPLFIIDSIHEYFSAFHSLYSINFLAYAILFACVSKAFLCMPKRVKW